MSFSESSSKTAMRPDGTATISSELAPMHYNIKSILQQGENPGTFGARHHTKKNNPFWPVSNVPLSGSMTTSAAYLLAMV